MTKLSAMILLYGVVFMTTLLVHGMPPSKPQHLWVCSSFLKTEKNLNCLVTVLIIQAETSQQARRLFLKSLDKRGSTPLDANRNDVFTITAITDKNIITEKEFQ